MPSNPQYSNTTITLDSFSCLPYPTTDIINRVLSTVYLEQHSLTVTVSLALDVLKVVTPYPLKCTTDSALFDCSLALEITGIPEVSILVEPKNTPQTTYPPSIKITLTFNNLPVLVDHVVNIPYGQNGTTTRSSQPLISPVAYEMPGSSHTLTPVYQTQYQAVSGWNSNSLFVTKNPMRLTADLFTFIQRNQTNGVLYSFSTYATKNLYQIDGSSFVLLGSTSNTMGPFDMTGSIQTVNTDTPFITTGLIYTAILTMSDVSSTAYIIVNNYKFPLPYPFGYVSRGLTGYSVNFKVSFLIPNSADQLDIFLNKYSISPVSNPLAGIPGKPTIDSITITQLTSYSYIVRMRLSDPAGISYINWDNTIYKTDCLADGMFFNGTFMFEVTNSIFRPISYTPNIIVGGFVESNRLQLNSLATYNLNGDVVPQIPDTLCIFKYQEVGLLDEPFENTLYFNVTRADKTARPCIIINYYEITAENLENNHTFCGYYNLQADMYSIDFTISKRQIIGIQTYHLLSSYRAIPHYELIGLFSVNATLNITSNLYGDLMRPMLKDILPVPINGQVSIPLVNSNITIGWDLTIHDYPNSFDHGVARVRSDLDNEPIIIYFNSSQRITGDPYNGKYAIRFTLQGNCVNQDENKSQSSSYQLPSANS
eukprot:gene18939-22665_t